MPAPVFEHESSIRCDMNQALSAMERTHAAIRTRSDREIDRLLPHAPVVSGEVRVVAVVGAVFSSWLLGWRLVVILFKVDKEDSAEKIYYFVQAYPAVDPSK